MSDAQIYDLYAQKISDITNIPYPYICLLYTSDAADD